MLPRPQVILTPDSCRGEGSQRHPCRLGTSRARGPRRGDPIDTEQQDTPTAGR